MAKYLMFGKYSSEAVKGIKSKRTDKVADLFKKHNGKIIGMYALIGPYDLVLIVDMPNNATLIKAAIDITKLTGIHFFSSPALTIEEFDRLAD